jgi:hypothetical protein
MIPHCGSAKGGDLPRCGRFGLSQLAHVGPVIWSGAAPRSVGAFRAPAETPSLIYTSSAITLTALCVCAEPYPLLLAPGMPPAVVTSAAGSRRKMRPTWQSSQRPSGL